MSELDQLQSTILAEIAAASDEAALEAVRVSALGKKGSVSALLATLGKMSPDERKTQGAAINIVKDAVTAEAHGATRRSEIRGARCAAQFGIDRCDAAAARADRRAGPHPSDQPGDRRTDRDLRRYGFRHRRRPGYRDRRLQLHQVEFPRGPSGPRDARHVLLQSEGRRLAPAAARTPHRCRCAPC